MLLIIKYKIKNNNKLINVKIKRNRVVFKKLLKGFNKISVKPIKLLIKKRGYRKIFSQKLFILIINLLVVQFYF